MDAVKTDCPPPPSYDEAMKCNTVAPTAPSDGSLPSQQITTTYGSFETQPLSVELPIPTELQTTEQIVPPTEVIVVNRCPACRVGVLEEGYSCLGILCAIIFFPVGIMCCLALRTERCPNCDTEY